MEQVQYRGTGRRKKAIAGVRVVPGNGEFFINGKPGKNYFMTKILQTIIRQPLDITENNERFNVIANVHGGGLSGQAGAVRLGLARALIKADIGLRGALKKAGFLMRDPRMKERRKYGLKKARKAPQFSKR